MGTLFLVATPIGNLEDISQRALRILSEVSLIAAEDTRHSGKLLRHFVVETPTLSYYDHNKDAREGEILAALSEGDVALISDAGTPGVSDPGHELVRAAWRAGHRVVPVPGASAALSALVASGLPPEPFLFLGYLPRSSKPRREFLVAHARDPWTLVAYEVPHRIIQALADIEDAFGGERPIAVCRELTKMHEEIQRGSVRQLRASLAESAPRGEYTLVIGGAESDPRWGEAIVRAAVSERLERGDRPSSVAREVAKLAGWNRRDVYQLTLEDQ
ncbi:MAG: 16S rRNA (cytidine(1402)-2'-O)-methyltransferase [Anaerolineales bacterium]